MKQSEFDRLVREYEELDEITTERKDKLVELIEEARDLNGEGIYLEKLSDEDISCLNIYISDDEDSPDGIAFCYDLFDIAPGGRIKFEDGGCYWGYVSIYEMLDEMLPGSWVLTDNEYIEDMVVERKFDYDILLKEISENE